MNNTLSTAARTILMDLLSQLPEENHRIFKLMYARNGGKRSVEDAENMPISDVVDQMPEDKIDWAISQCEATITKKQLTK